MKTNPIYLITLFSFCLTSSFILAQNDTLEINLNVVEIQNQLRNAPNILSIQNKQSNRQISLPSLDGQQHAYFVYETVNIEEPLYSQYPEIRSYILINKKDPTHTGRLSTGGKGINVMTKKKWRTSVYIPFRC